MSIGDYNKNFSRSRLGSFLQAILGADLHTHIRLKPVLKYLSSAMVPGKHYEILEIGCGPGVVAYELNKLGRDLRYIGFDLNESDICKAKNVFSRIGEQGRFSFVCADATIYDFKKTGGKFDIILLVDVMEHVDNPTALVDSLLPHMNSDALFLVSAPTGRFQLIFGRRFHKNIGHVRNGFTKDELFSVFSKSDPLFHEYNTGLPCNLGCAIYYRLPYTWPKLTLAKNIALLPFRYLDLINGSLVSASHFAVFKRRAAC